MRLTLTGPSSWFCLHLCFDLLTEFPITVSLSVGKEASRKPIFFPLVLFNNDDNNLNSACSHCSCYLFNILVCNLLPRLLYCFSYIRTISNGLKTFILNY